MGSLSTLNVAITGKLPAEPAAIKRWLDANGARYSATVTNGVTHLVASKEAWKNVTDPVLMAANLSIPIVSYDWLEDSLQKKRKLSEKKYTFEALQQDRQRRREMKKLGKTVDSKRFIEGCEEITKLTGSGTSKVSSRKKSKSKIVFFGEILNTPFVSAADDLRRRRAEREEREAAEVVKRAEKALKKKASSSEGTQTKPIEIDDGAPMTSRTVSGSLHSAPSAQSHSPASLSKLSTPQESTNTSIPSELQAKTQTLKDLYHYYIDPTGFEYKIMLSRSNFSQNSITVYQLSILESHIEPHTYCTLVQYKPPSGTPATNQETTATASATKPRNHQLSFLNKNSNTQTTPFTPTDQASPTLHPEAARLKSLVTSPVPTATTLYRTLICPMNSLFTPAWQAFRHAFRDLTLLNWEERFDEGKAVQKTRAQVLQVEPFVYARPSQGLPIGLTPQIEGLHQGGAVVVKDSYGPAIKMPFDGEDGYVRNKFNLPGMEEKLAGQGVVGASIVRDEEARRRKGEEVARAKAAAEARKKEADRAARRAGAGRGVAGGGVGDGEAYARFLASGGARGMMFGDMARGGNSHWGWGRE